MRVTRRQALGTIGTMIGMGVAGCSGSSGSGGSGPDELVFEVDFLGEWAGSVTADGEQRSIDGTSSMEGTISPPPATAALTAQKREPTGKLTVRFVYGGEVVSEESTTAEYGTATTSVSGL